MTPSVSTLRTGLRDFYEDYAACLDADELLIATELAALPRWAVRRTRNCVTKAIKRDLDMRPDTPISCEALSTQIHGHADAVKSCVEQCKPEFRGR